MASQINSTDGVILSTFAAYSPALAAYNEAPEGENTTGYPAYDRWNEIYLAMDSCPMPTTLEGAATLLRWGLSTNDGPPEELEYLLLDGTAEQISAYVAKNWKTFGSDKRHAYGALAVIETLRSTADGNSSQIAEALEDYRRKRAASDAMPLGAEGEDAAVDEYCDVMDRLIEKIPAATISDVVTKIELGKSRGDGFNDSLLPDHLEAIDNDLQRLASGSAVVAAPSLILALHARYEEAWDEYNQLDDANGELSSDASTGACAKRFRFDEGMERNSDETSALRLAILHQVPKTRQEALVLAFHVHGWDPTDGTEYTEAEKKAFTTGLDTLLHFMVEQEQGGGLNGFQFNNAAEIVRSHVAYRTGKVGEAA